MSRISLSSGHVRGPSDDEPVATLSRRGFLVGTGAVGGLVAFGGAELPSAVAASARHQTSNLLSNPGFEATSGAKPVDWQPFNANSDSLVMSSTTTVRSGARSVRLQDPSSAAAVGLRSFKVAVEPGTVYEASVHLYNLRGSSDLYLEFWNASGARIAVEYRRSTERERWQEVRVRAEAPEGAAHATVLIYQGKLNVAESFADDASLTAVVLDQSRVETFGPASLTASLVAAAVEDDTCYLVTRGQTPPKLVTVDLVNRRVESIARLDRGDGAWAMTISGGKVYVGAYPTPDLYSYDPVTRHVERLGTIGPDGGIVWCLTTAPDGVVYAGTYPRCEVWEYTPTTGTLRNLGAATDDVPYARTIAADDAYVYVGTTPRRHVIAIDRATGSRTDILPEQIERDGAVDAIVASGGRVIASAGDLLIDMAPDGSEPIFMSAPGAPFGIDALTVTPDGELLASAKRVGDIYRRVGNTLELAATTNVGDDTRGIFMMDDGALLGAGRSGVLWFHSFETGETEVFDLADTEVAGPDLVQSIAFDGSAVYVGGHFAVTVHRPWDDHARRIRVAGEAKALAPVDGKLIAAMYPSGELAEIDPVTGDVRSYGLIGHDQQRPWEAVYDAARHRVLVASAARYGMLDGALTILDPDTGEMDVHTDLIPGQSLLSVTVDGGIAYVAGDTRGGGSIPPESDTAQIAAFDLENRTVLWRTGPIAGCRSLQHIEVHAGILYGVYKRLSGTWFAMDLESKEILDRGVLSGYGEVVYYRGRIFAATNFSDDISCIGPDREEFKRLLGPIPTSWYTVPQLEFDRHWKAWGVSDRQLARFDLHPRHERAVR